MKNIKQIALVLCVGFIAFLNSCGKKSDNPQLSAIPADAFFVVALENKQIIDKGGLGNLKDFKFFKEIINNVENEQALTVVENFVTNPKELGLNNDLSYIFGLSEGDDFGVAMSFGVENVSKLEKHINELLKDENVDIVDKGNYKIINEAGPAIAWSKDILIAGGMSEGTMDFGKLFSMSDSKSIASNSDFQTFHSRKFDVGIWLEYDKILDLASSISYMKQPDIFASISGMFLHSYINFDAGELKITYLMSPEAKVKEFNKRYPIIKKDFDNSLLRAFPEKSFFTWKFAFDIPAYIKMMEDVLDANEKAAIKEMMKDPTVSSIINGLGGDFLLSLYGFAQGPFPIPLAGIAFTVNSKDDFDKLISLVPLDLTKKDDYYFISVFGFSAYVAYKDNKVFITDDDEAITAFTGKGFDKSLANSELNKSLMYFYINLDVDSYPESIRNMLAEGGESMLGFQPLTFLRLYKDFSITMKNDYETEFSLKLSDKGQNSLKQLIKFIDELMN